MRERFERAQHAYRELSERETGAEASDLSLPRDEVFAISGTILGVLMAAKGPNRDLHSECYVGFVSWAPWPSLRSTDRIVEFESPPISEGQWWPKEN